jgi:alpha-amylase
MFPTSSRDVVIARATAAETASAEPADAAKAPLAATNSKELDIRFDNCADDECTIITVEGRDQGDLLMTMSGAFASSGINVVSATISTEDNGNVVDVFRVSEPGGTKLNDERFGDLRAQILELCSNTYRSSKPAIYGIVAAAEAKRLRPLTSTAGKAPCCAKCCPAFARV